MILNITQTLITYTRVNTYTVEVHVVGIKSWAMFAILYYEPSSTWDKVLSILINTETLSKDFSRSIIR